MQVTELSDASRVSPAALAALAADADLPMCATCATQYPAPRRNCPVCDDPRQYVPGSGQAWTTLGKLIEEGRKNIVMQDKEDERIKLLGTVPSFAISQSPFLIETNGGSYIWDCMGTLTPALVDYLTHLKTPLKAMAISHPHFFSTSLTWSRVLGVSLFINSEDRHWYQRDDDLKPTDKVKFWNGKQDIGPGVTLVQCGGHFPGSSVLFWDRAAEPAGAKSADGSAPAPTNGLLLTADTIMVQPTQKGFTFMWSYPNMVPLEPIEMLKVVQSIQHLDYGAVSSAWPDRFVRHDAKKQMLESVAVYLDQTGWEQDDTEHGALRPKATGRGRFLAG
ncbi:uncharacterized protein EHS24_002885 [Apiotrichum porosum]|uniref:Metallo-beta-lactamase domain-containing protein n=1 Tax=Apiotrichum porosum TaxID=105984 RepID=A0A427XG08_9TREE|nr:uncharacterized protein EHS24_002885 [Apiotrichum porosum]RSH77825.1 hypothetical protein EHS24_002885 [Apiotrichum porosum]